MKPDQPNPRALPFRYTDLGVAFYETAADFPNENFDQITKRLLPNGFGSGKTAEVLKREARRNFDLARL
jgi:hypothetical protein